MSIKVIDRTGKEPFVRTLKDEEFEMIAGPWRDMPPDILDAMERAYWKSVETLHNGECPPDFCEEDELIDRGLL